MLFPRGRRDALTGVFLNTAGGMTGGDKFAISAHAQAASRLTLTSQAAERIYGAASGTATLSTTLRVDEGARLDWMPQETILFEQSALRRSLDVTVAQGATFLMVEPVVFGRLAMGERVRHGTFVDKVRVRDSDGLLFADQITLNGDLDLVLQGLAVGHGALAMASVLFVAPDAAAHLTTLRYLMPATGGVSLIRDRVLFIRILAADSFVLRQSLLPVLRVLYGADLPKTWML